VSNSGLEIEWGYAKQIEIVGDDRSSLRSCLRLNERPVSIRDRCRQTEAWMSQQSIRQAARRSALNAQAGLRKQRADRERRLEALAVEVLTALGERAGAVQDAELRAGGALLAMTDEEGLSVREAVEWCGSVVTLREVTRLRRLADEQSGGGTGASIQRV
jgi:hypothetical protein